MKRQRGEFPWDPHWENKASTRLWCPAVLAKLGAQSRGVLVILTEGFSKKKKPFGSSKKNLTFKARLSAKHMLIGQLHDDVILLQLQIKAIVL